MSMCSVVAQPGQSFMPTAVCRVTAGVTISITPAQFVNSSVVHCSLPNLGAATGSVTVAIANKLDPGVQGGAAAGNRREMPIIVSCLEVQCLMKRNDLPRQARDELRETQNKMAFHAA